MLNIKVNDQYLNLSKTSISFELLSPIFNDIGSFSYPFTFPSSPHNRSILGFPDRINYGQATAKSHEAEIYINGLLWKRGKLTVKEAGNQQIKANLAVGEGYFYSTIKDKTLNDAGLGGKRSLAPYVTAHEYNGVSYPRYFDAIIDKVYPETDFNLFPVYAPNFYKEQDFYNTWLSSTDGFINTWRTSSPLVPDFNGFQYWGYATFVLFPFVNYLLDQIAAYTGSAISKNIFYDDPALRRLVIFRLFSISEMLGEAQRLADQFDLSDNIGHSKIADLLSRLSSVFNSFLFYDDFTKDIRILLFKEIINSEPVNLENAKYRMISLEPNDYNGYQVSYEIDGDDEFAEEHFKDLDGLNYKGSLNTFFELPANPSDLDLYFIKPIKAYYYYVGPRSFGGNTYFGEWRYYCGDKKGYSEGNQGLKIAIPGVFSRGENELVMRVGNEGAMTEPGEMFYKAPEIPLKFLFYTGRDGSGVPRGDSFDVNGRNPYSIEWENERGLKNTFYKDFLQFKSTTRQAEFSMRLTPAQLKNLDFSKPYRFANANWLIDKVSFSVTNTGITTATVKAWKIQ